jgi:hypothetical protein
MKSTLSLQKSIFILDGHRGTYIPQNLAEIMVNERHLHTYEFTTDSATLKRMLDELIEGQDNEFYWDNWNDILSFYTEIRNTSNNELFYLTQTEDGDLWLVHEDELHEWNEDHDIISLDYNEFTLVVDLNERGEYKCHVENCEEDVVWECGTLDAMSLVDDGFLPCVPHECVEDVLEYLQSHNVLGENSKLIYNN